MENAPNKKIALPLILLALGLAVGFAAGFYQGARQGAATAENRLASVLDLAFPKPPTEMFALTGAVKRIYGATIELEIDNPDDYLPHPDQSPRAKETRRANVIAATSYATIDFSKLDAEGNPSRAAFTLADLKEGDIVTVRSAQNIKDVQTFDVVAVERVIY